MLPPRPTGERTPWELRKAAEYWKHFMGPQRIPYLDARTGRPEGQTPVFEIDGRFLSDGWKIVVEESPSDPADSFYLFVHAESGLVRVNTSLWRARADETFMAQTGAAIEHLLAENPGIFTALMPCKTQVPRSK